MQTLKTIMDTFGANIFVPIVIFLICIFMKINVKKAINSAILAAVGLIGFDMITNYFTPVISPVVDKMVKLAHLNLPVLDIGWQATAVIAYSTQIGMVFIAVLLIFQVFLFAIKWTNVFMPSDLWNNYSLILWGSELYFVTKNMWLASFLMLFGNMVCLLYSEVIANRWSTYYGYPQCTLSAPHQVGNVPFALILNVVLSKLGADKIQLNPENIRKKLGFLGDPMIIGFIVGFLLGFIGNFTTLTAIASWGQILTTAVTTSAVMAIFPKIGSIFAASFSSITSASQKSMKKGGREWYVAVNDALGYGESATLTTGILMIPFALIMAFILPGNIIVPVMCLTGFAYDSEINIALADGNIFKALIMDICIFAGQLYIGSYFAPMFTKIAKQVGVKIPGNSLMVIGFVAANILLGLITIAFMTKNPLIIGIIVILYIVQFIYFKKNKKKVIDTIEKHSDYSNVRIAKS
ncbi:PTS transporter subunit IIC [Lactobacillus sp. ESL0677]|uniref:PTS transporter subunit IIC n=1 Tax=Lactobacillus sp. ESL0677 TaxID=2983208 RepID=UPI0023F9F840|nr:PTS transporter subunit IIC [Lactobacillus sp. ESL0677]WEV36111.1 PTS galactitol transporter subunit IIC [Lactobacillus sp. ESL0677]